MCGIAGLAGYRDDETLLRMSARLIHRGPDDSDNFFADNISFAHRRLSIIDPEGGRQPVLAERGRVALIFNGEIYNFQEIKDLLTARGHHFHTRCDSEVLLHGYLEWGLEMLPRLNGMFAFALADLREQEKLYLVRDRLGIKPLYFTQSGTKLAFASEIKALLELPWLDRALDPLAIDHYLQLRYVPGPGTLFQNVQQVPPATVLTFHAGIVKAETYWTLADTPMSSGIDEAEALERLDALLTASVKRRMIADVPVGAYLSGGVDSACIAALMLRQGSGPLNTFTVGFGTDQDELSEAAACARRLGTQHHEVHCSPQDFTAMEKVVYHLDQPIGDPIVLPMFLLAQEARRHVKVVLCGEGADEIFAGYLFHKVIVLATKVRRPTPKLLIRLARLMVKISPHALLNLFFQYPAGLGREGKSKLVHFLELLEGSDPARLFRYLITLFDEQPRFRLYTPSFMASLQRRLQPIDEWLFGADDTNRLLSIQYRDWLPDLMLLKQDKLTMAHGLEGRFLFMDHELVTFLASLPGSFKVRGWRDKILLRRYAKEYLDLPAATHPKKPFFIPVEQMKALPTRFDHLTFLNLKDIRRGDQEFLHRRREMALWMLDLFFEAHGLEARFV